MLLGRIRVALVLRRFPCAWPSYRRTLIAAVQPGVIIIACLPISRRSSRWRRVPTAISNRIGETGRSWWPCETVYTLNEGLLCSQRVETTWSLCFSALTTILPWPLLCQIDKLGLVVHGTADITP